MTLHVPWEAWREPWVLHVEGVEVDGVDHLDLLAADHRRVDVSSREGWVSAVLSLRAAPPPDGDAPGVTGLVVHALVTCRDTHWRAPTVLVAQVDGSWTGSVALSSDVLAGAVTVDVTATSVVEGRRRVVGVSEAWRVVVDPGEAPTAAGAPPFRTVWTDFQASDAPAEVRGAPDTYAVLAPVGAELVLYLNGGIEGLQELLHADRARDRRRMARDLVGAEVARQALASVVRSALAEVVETSEGDVPGLPAGRTARQAVEAVARAMPRVAGAQDLVERVVAAEDGSAVERALLWSEIDAAVAVLAGTTAAIAATAKEVRFA